MLWWRGAVVGHHDAVPGLYIVWVLASDPVSELPLPILRNRDALGRLVVRVKPKSEEPAPPIRLGSPRSMALGYTHVLQEQHQQQWQRLPGKRLLGRFLRRAHQSYRPPPIPRDQYKVEIVGRTPLEKAPEPAPT